MKRSAVNEIVPEEKEAIATLPKNGSKNGSKTPAGKRKGGRAGAGSAA